MNLFVLVQHREYDDNILSFPFLWIMLANFVELQLKWANNNNGQALNSIWVMSSGCHTKRWNWTHWKTTPECSARKYPSQCTAKDLLLSKRNYTMRLYCLQRIPSRDKCPYLLLFTVFPSSISWSYFFLLGFLFDASHLDDQFFNISHKCIDTARAFLFLLVLPRFTNAFFWITMHVMYNLNMLSLLLRAHKVKNKEEEEEGRKLNGKTKSRRGLTDSSACIQNTKSLQIHS